MSTFAELAQDVLDELGTGIDPLVWTTDDAKEAINEGMEELADETEWYERITPFSLGARRTYYDVRGISQEFQVLTVTDVSLRNPVRWLKPCSVRDIDGESYGTWGFPQWERVQGRSVRFFMRSPFWMGIHPQPTADEPIAQMSHTSIPPRMKRDEDQPGIVMEFERALVCYGVFDLLSQDGETTRALAYYAEYSAYAKSFAMYVQGRQNRDRLYGMKEESVDGPLY